MAEEYTLPSLGENIEGGDLLAVLVKVGDRIARDQGLLELETDKAVLEVPSTFSGTIEKILVQAGDHLRVGQSVLVFLPTDTDSPRSEGSAPEAAEPETPLLPPSPAPVTPRAPQPARSLPAQAPAPPGGGDSGARVVEFNRPISGDGTPVAAAPSVRRLAREIGVDIRRIEGSGLRGRISREDVKAYAKGQLAAGPTAVPVAGALPDFSRWGSVSRERMSGVRRATANQMARSWNQIPHVTQVDESDVTELETRRKAHAAGVEQEGGKLTVTAILLKVLASAVRKFPQFAASLDLAQEEIVFKDYVHVGVAVETPRGLLVPVIRDVDEKNLLQLSRELREVAERARQGKLSLEEMQGGCITVTNLGGIGGTSFTPIINWPEVAILGVSRAGLKPVFEGHEFRPRLVMPLSLSYDHRLIDGADAARFLRWICRALEDPFLLVLEG